MNKGVEAKEIEIANTRLDENPATAGGGAAPRSRSPPTTDRSSASFVQVVVQKQRRGQRRLPTASSPAPVDPRSMARTLSNAEQGEPGGQGVLGARGRAPDDRDVGAVLLTWPALAALQRQGLSLLDSQRNIEAEAKETGNIVISTSDEVDKRHAYSLRAEKTKKSSIWKKLSAIASGKETGSGVDGPERVAVYGFERGGDALCARTGDRDTRVERLARALAPPAARLLAELLALLRILVAMPFHVLLHIERCVLGVGVGAACGAVQTASDEALKPALALCYNAVARPPLVLAAQLAAALRDALRPLWLALGDALQPLAGLLAACRSDHVERPCPCLRRV